VLEFEATVDDMELVYENEREVAEAMGQAIHQKLTTRLAFGLGAHGRLPTPNDGGKPLIRTGTAAASIGVGINEKNGKVSAVVRAFGDRPENENVGAKVARAKRKTKEMRAATAVALTLQSLSGRSVAERFVRKKPTKSGNVFKLSSIRVRTADTNAALFGILSVPPKDPRAKNGGRGVYRVFEKTDYYMEVAAAAARRVARFILRKAA
jgi:hypothetical protein